jgi:hypothetical protein
MKTLAACGLFVFFASGLLAQRHSIGTTLGTNAGYGNVVFPGGRPAITTPFTQAQQLTGTSFPTTLGNVVAGRPVFNGTVGKNHGTGAIVYVPYGYPVYTGGLYGGGYYGGGYYGPYGDPSAAAPPPQQQPNITIVYPPMQPTPVMMGPGGQLPPPNGQIHEYVPPPQSAPEETTQAQPQADYYLLAFKDHSIYSAVGYWLDGDTMHYITTGNVHNQVSLSLVDRDLTTQLNKGRGVQVNLPPSR